MNLVVGVDLDNTIVSYDELLHRVAVEHSLINRSTRKSKRRIRDIIRELPHGDMKWQKLQALVYGPKMKEAELIKGVSKFFRLCKKNDAKVYIISHKTEFASYDKTKTNLRSAAIDWMEKNKFFKDKGLSLSKKDVYFEATRAGKISKIKELRCTHFIDDLEETFLEETFPKEVEKILYDPHQGHKHLVGAKVFASWDGINKYLFSKKSEVLQKEAILSRVLGKDIASIKNIGDGRNSRVYLLTYSNNRRVIAKFYFSHEFDKRDRMNVEFNSLKFLWDNGVRCVPEPIDCYKNHNFALYSYIEGVKVSNVTSADIQVASGFLRKLDSLKNEKRAAELPEASEACFSVEDIAKSINKRYKRLASLRNNKNNKPLHEFLEKEFMPSFQGILQWCKSEIERHKIGYSTRIGKKDRTLSPSDFGFHNALREKNGSIVFLDFEYFGWDDPAKMMSDFLLHPGMQLTEKLKKQFINNMAYHFQDKNITKRLGIVYPLFGLKWCLILLNEFVNEDFLRRRFAYNGSLPRRPILTQQLLKAKQLLTQINREFSNFTFV